MESTQKKILLKSVDKETFEVDEAVAMKSQTIMKLIKDAPSDSVIRVPYLSGEILGKVLEYCKKHVDPATDKNELKAWDTDFVEINQNILYGLWSAADFLKIKSLSSLAFRREYDMIMADFMMGRTEEQIRRALNLNRDFTRRRGRILGGRAGGHSSDSEALKSKCR